jgi:peptide/nickel transport system substrate-binding protein
MDYHSAEMDWPRYGPLRDRSDGHDENVVKVIQLSFDDVPAIPLFQPYLNLATQTNVTGYRYLFHRQLDYRHFAKI